MQWPEFAHAVRAAGAILGEDQVVVDRSTILARLDDAEVADPVRDRARATLQG